MYIAQQLKQKNIAEYLIYMWQVEDMIRANNLDIDRIEQTIISQYQGGEEVRRELRTWYENLIGMMRDESVAERGHLQINKNVIIKLTELHNHLVNSSEYPFYIGAYYKALPFIVELRNKNGRKDDPEIETCFEALYGIMLLRLQNKPVGEGTVKAAEAISSFLSMLANYYDKQIAL